VLENKGKMALILLCVTSFVRVHAPFNSPSHRRSTARKGSLGRIASASRDVGIVHSRSFRPASLVPTALLFCASTSFGASRHTRPSLFHPSQLRLRKVQLETSLPTGFRHNDLLPRLCLFGRSFTSLSCVWEGLGGEGREGEWPE
jgi:hypothetical protein